MQTIIYCDILYECENSLYFSTDSSVIFIDLVSVVKKSCLCENNSVILVLYVIIVFIILTFNFYFSSSFCNFVMCFCYFSDIYI